MNDSPTPDPMDFTRLRETSGGDLDFEREVLALYLKDTRGRLVRIHEGLITDNPEEIRRLAHTIKGASASAGAVQLNTLAAQLEEQAIQADLSRGQSALAKLEEAYTATTESIGRPSRNHRARGKAQADRPNS